MCLSSEHYLKLRFALWVERLQCTSWHPAEQFRFRWVSRAESWEQTSVPVTKWEKRTAIDTPLYRLCSPWLVIFRLTYDKRVVRLKFMSISLGFLLNTRHYILHLFLHHPAKLLVLQAKPEEHSSSRIVCLGPQLIWEETYLLPSWPHIVLSK